MRQPQNETEAVVVDSDNNAPSNKFHSRLKISAALATTVLGASFLAGFLLAGYQESSERTATLMVTNYQIDDAEVRSVPISVAVTVDGAEHSCQLLNDDDLQKKADVFCFDGFEVVPKTS